MIDFFRALMALSMAVTMAWAAHAQPTDAPAIGKALVPKRNHATLGEAAFARARPPRS